MTKVWITRTLPGAQDTARAVAAMGLVPVVAPLLDVVATEVGPAPAGHDIAFTSPNGVRHYRGPTDMTAWCVGGATARAAREAGFADVRVGPGDVAGLTERLRAELIRPLIHWAGAHVRGSLAEDLAAAGHDARRVIAYRAQAVEASPITDPVDVVLLHSPRAAEVFAQLAPDMARASVAISAAADAPLATIGELARFTARTPDEPAMLDALANAVYEAGMTDEIEEIGDDTVIVDRPDAVHERPVPAVRRGIGLPLLLGVGVLSALAGTAGGYALSQLDGADADTVQSVQSLREDVATLRRAQGSLVQQVGDLERGPDSAQLEGEIERLALRLSAVEAQAETTIQRPVSEVNGDALAQLRTRLDALEDARPVDASSTDTLPSSPRPALTPALARRLADMESRLDTLETSRSAASVPLPTPDISYSGGRASAGGSTASVARPAVRTALPDFPYAAVEAALDNPEDASPAGRALRRFVRVRKVDADAALDELRTALAEGDTRLALAAFARLPETAQVPARDWEAAARARIEE